MKHLKALAIKFIAVFVALFITVNFAISFSDTLMMSLLFTLVGYFIGDLFVLPFTGKFIATILDAALVWVAGTFLYHSYTDLAPVLTAGVIAIVEWFFHYYVEAKVLERETAR